MERKLGAWVITTVDPSGPAAGRLVPEDTLLAVNGDAHLGPSLWLHFTPLQGRTYSVRVRRADREVDVSLSVTAVAEPGTAVEIDIFGEWVAGEVAAEPLWDPAGERVKG